MVFRARNHNPGSRFEPARKAFMSSCKPKKKEPLKDKVLNASTSALDLLEKLLHFDPTKRIGVEEAL